MFNVSTAQESGEHRAQATIAKKLIQAAALAAVLVPLGSVVAGAAPINCTTGNEGSGFCEANGSYIGDEGEQSNTWKFFADSSFQNLIYTLDITGTPTSTFSLSARDFVTDQESLDSSEVMGEFAGAQCIPTFDFGRCGLFDVFEVFGTAQWNSAGYYMTIAWFTNADPLSQPGLIVNDPLNVILQAPNNSGGVFTNQLADSTYQPVFVPVPDDPALGGRGDSFSRFGGFRTAGFETIPEPATLMLFGTGIATALYRTRRRRQI